MIPDIKDIKREKDWYKIKSSKYHYWEEYKLYIENTKFVLGEVVLMNKSITHRVIAKFAHWVEYENITINSSLSEQDKLKLIDDAWQIAMKKLLTRMFK